MKLLWQQIPSPIITDIFCNSNFDGIVFDLEHGLFNNESLYSCIQVCDLSQKKSLIRVPYLDRQIIRMALDANVSGVILSTVEDKQEAQDFYDYCVYPYKKRVDEFKTDNRGVIRKNTLIKTGGKRGQGLVRENGWGTKPLKLRKPLLIPQIETLKGVDNIQKISEIDFDFFLVGPYDLSASIGAVGDFESKNFKDAINKLTINVGDRLGFHVPSQLDKEYEKVKDYNLLALGMDTTFLVESINKSSSLIDCNR